MKTQGHHTSITLDETRGVLITTTPQRGDRPVFLGEPVGENMTRVRFHSVHIERHNSIERTIHAVWIIGSERDEHD